MKKILLTLSIIVAVFASSTAQQAVKVGPLGFILGFYNVKYEKALSDKGSFQIGGNFYNYKLFDIKTTGFGLDAGYRHYFREAIKGAYVSPVLSYDFNSTSVSTIDDTKGKFSTLGISGMFGYQWISGGGFVVDLGLGYGYSIEVSKDDSLLEDYSRGGVRFGFAIGYAF